jgi:hypothetical protein
MLGYLIFGIKQRLSVVIAFAKPFPFAEDGILGF